MNMVKVLLTCGISLALTFCFCGTAFATEPINTKGDLAAQMTEYATITGQRSSTADIPVYGYIVPQETAAATTPKPGFPSVLPKTGDASLSKRSLTLGLIILALMAVVLYGGQRMSRDKEDKRTFGTDCSEKT
ncbi:MAG: hypothetical protein FWC54_04030 [Actinomycetia bacterium]|nr:hypothetical protein [Actinomycetes bacterium]